MVTFFIAVVYVSNSGDISIQGAAKNGVVRGNMKWTVEGQSVGIRRMLKRDVGALGKTIEPKEAKEGQVVQLFLTGADAAIIKKYTRKAVEFHGITRYDWEQYVSLVRARMKDDAMKGPNN